MPLAMVIFFMACNTEQVPRLPGPLAMSPLSSLCFFSPRQRAPRPVRVLAFNGTRLARTAGNYNGLFRCSRARRPRPRGGVEGAASEACLEGERKLKSHSFTHVFPADEVGRQMGGTTEVSDGRWSRVASESALIS